MRQSVRELLKNRDNITIVKNIGGSAVIRAISIVVSLFLLPAYMRYFGDARVLGVWVTVISVVTWVLSFDLGVGNGLRNRLGAALARHDERAAREYISSAYVLFGCIVAVLAACSILALRFVDLNAFLNISGDVLDGGTLTGAIIGLVVAILVYFFLGMISSILYALQRAALPSLLALASNVLLLAFLLIDRAPSSAAAMVRLASFYMVAMNSPLLVATVIVFATRLRRSRPSVRLYRGSRAQDVLNLGVQFFFVQTALMVIHLTNELLITRLFRPADSVIYQIYNRVFSSLVMLFSIVTSTLWSAVTKACAEGDVSRVRTIRGWLLKGAGLFSVLCVVLGVAFPSIQVVWLGENRIETSPTAVLCFVVFAIVMIHVAAVSCIANGMGKVRLQAVYFSIAAVAKITLSIAFAQAWGGWLVVVVVTAIAMAPYVLVQLVVTTRDINTLGEVADVVQADTR